MNFAHAQAVISSAPQYKEALADCNSMMQKLRKTYGKSFSCVALVGAPSNEVFVQYDKTLGSTLGAVLQLDFGYPDPLDVDDNGYHLQFTYDRSILGTLINMLQSGRYGY